jgi:hypothetical protein
MLLSSDSSRSSKLLPTELPSHGMPAGATPGSEGTPNGHHLATRPGPGSVAPAANSQASLHNQSTAPGLPKFPRREAPPSAEMLQTARARHETAGGHEHAASESRPPKLLDQVRNRLRVMHRAIGAEKQYVSWKLSPLATSDPIASWTNSPISHTRSLPS